jgi:ATP-binding cassette subfamily G (WHITE) protein 2 (SNQ2)
MTFLFTSLWEESNEQKGLLLVPSELAKQARPVLKDEEAQQNEKSSHSSSRETSAEGSDTNLERQLTKNTSVFSWKNLTYTVQTSDGPRVLLNSVDGFVKPGSLGALMGASGAGKTTLLDVLAQRKTDGTIHGSVLVDGRPLSTRAVDVRFCDRFSDKQMLTLLQHCQRSSGILCPPPPV